MTIARKWSLVALLIGILAAAVAAGCGDDEESTTGGDTTAAELQTLEDGVLTVGSDIPYEPFEGGDAPDYEGFDIDVVNAIATELGLEVEIQDTPFDTIFRDVSQGKFDMVASATTITPERQKTVDFSDPYFQADQSLMVRSDSEIESTEDLGGTTVGAQKGTTGASYAQNQTDAATVRTYPEIGDAFTALNNTQVDAVINDFAISKYAEGSNPDLTVVERIPTEEYYGFAFAKGNTGLVDAVNDALQKIKDDGTYAEIYETWFDEDPPESILSADPGSVSGDDDAAKGTTDDDTTAEDGNDDG
jgi:polar amino acid transport system substrate-binding protein